MLRTIATLALFLSSAFAYSAEPAPARRNGNLAIAAHDILRRYCAECHTGSPDPGKSKLRLLDHNQLTAKGRPVPLVARDRSLLLDLVKDGSMPPANRRAPTREEVELLEAWVAAGAPAYPETFDERFVLEAIADDLDKANGAAQSRRYVSFAHLLGDSRPLTNLTDALSLATGAPVKLEPIEPTATVFRLDLDQLGWRTRDLFEQFEGRRPAGAHPLRPFDLLLLEYPFAALPAEDAVTKRLEPFLARKNQVRPVPYVRGDWLATALASGGELTPLGKDLRSLAALERALARSGTQPCGPPVPRTLGEIPFSGAKLADGRTPVGPLSAWYTGDVLPVTAPFEFTAELVSDGQVVKGVKVGQPFQLRVSSERRVFLTLLMVQADGEVRVHDLGGKNVLPAKTERDLAPGADGFVISSILTSGPAATEYFVLFAAETDLPLPVIVQSTHPDRTVWRFLLEPTAKEPFDPNKVVRKVIPIPVTRK